MSAKKRAPSIYSHVVVHDYGFAPNPYGGFLSIATCKPRIRSSAHIGDWVVGVGSAGTVGGDRAVYAVLIDEIVLLEAYGREERFAVKRPTFRAEEWQRVGDSVYYQDEVGSWRRRPSLHDASHVKRDLSGKRVLLGHEFYYFGSLAPSLPGGLSLLAHPGRGHRRFEDEALITELAKWLRREYKPSVIGEPYHKVHPKRVVAHNTTAPADQKAPLSGC